MNAEGWYQDPYKIHQDRWYSDGCPTALVRDGEAVAQDPPPTGARPSGPLVASVPHGTGGPEDLRRADEAEAGEGPADPDYGEIAEEASVFMPPD